MKKSNQWLPLLSSLLLVCAYIPEGSAVVSTEVASNGVSSDQADEEQFHWPYPEQEIWVEEPIFSGNLHLVEAGKQNHQTIILIHGLGYRGVFDWVRVFPELTDRYHVIAIDLPGFGSSDKHDVQYLPEKYARLVNWVVSQRAHGPVIVIGHSMGGAVSLRFAHNYPKQVSRLIMVDTAGLLQRTVYIRHIAKVPVTYKWLTPYQANIPGLDRLIRKIARKADGWTQSLLITVDRLPDIPQLMMSSDLARRYLYKDRSTLNAALGLVYEDFSDAAREVAVPTHIIWGEHDSVAPIRTGRVLAGLLPNAELHVISAAGHVPMTDNFEDFIGVLNISLENEPRARQAQKRLAVVKNESAAQKSIHCDSQNNLVYTGHYGLVNLRDCHGVVFRDLVADSIVLVSSEATLENVELNSADRGLTAINSVVTATLLQIDAEIGLSVENSFLDLAGANIVAWKDLVDIREDSQLYFSLSEYKQNNQVSNLHGVSVGQVFNLH